MSNALVTTLIAKTKEMLNILGTKNEYLTQMKLKTIPDLLSKEDKLIDAISSLKEEILKSGISLTEKEKEECLLLQQKINAETNSGNRKLQAVYAVHNNIIGFIKDEIEKSIKNDTNYNFSGQQHLSTYSGLPPVSLNQTA